MNAKKAKKIRQVERKISRAETKLYESKLAIWEAVKPPRWRIFKYRKWLKVKPKEPKGC